jgi:hypothetical protein
MTLPPAIPIIFLILGALAIGASELARLRRPTVILIITTLLALAALLTVRGALPVTQIVAAWQPVSVFTVPLSFRVDETAWLLALGLLLVLLGRIPGVGRLPGDILIRRDNVTIFIPLGTMVVVSLLLTLLLNLISRWKR